MSRDYINIIVLMKTTIKTIDLALLKTLIKQITKDQEMDNLSYRGRPDRNDTVKEYDGLKFSASPHDFKPISNKKQNLHSKIYNKINWKLIWIVLAFWTLLINYYERSVVKRAMNACQWSIWEKWVCISLIRNHRIDCTNNYILGNFKSTT